MTRRALGAAPGRQQSLSAHQEIYGIEAHPAHADEELTRLYAYLDSADAEGLEHPVLTLAIRLQFEFAARMSEVLLLE